jgi:hypothetical protein
MSLPIAAAVCLDVFSGFAGSAGSLPSGTMLSVAPDAAWVSGTSEGFGSPPD